MARISAKALYRKLEDSNTLASCEDYARWTLAPLMVDPSPNFGRRRSVVKDYQSMGALLVNSLASKFAQLLFPTTHPFFNLDAEIELKDAARRRGISSAKFNSTMVAAVKKACAAIFRNSSYANLVLAMKHLIVTGNVLLYRDSVAKKTLAYGLRNFVTRRAGNGDVLVCIFRERTYVEALPIEEQRSLQAINRSRYSRPEQEVETFVKIQREALEGGRHRWIVTREVDEFVLPGEAIYGQDTCPWQPIAIELVAGEHYGRGLVEAYAGDFSRLSDISEAAVLYGIEISRLIYLVQTGGNADIDELQAAETGDYVRGDKDAVTTANTGNMAHLSGLLEMENGTFARLSRAFMYNGPARDAERVTRYELQLQAEEANQQFGGMYSTLAEAIQIPLAILLLIETSPEFLSAVVTSQLRPNITAGVNALGQQAQMQTIVSVAQEASVVIPAFKAVDPRVDTEKLMDLFYQSRAIDPESILYDQATQMKLKEAEAQRQSASGELAQAASAQDALQAVQEQL